MDYSRKQRDAINRAWSWLEDITDRSDWSAKRRLKDALTYERAQRQSAPIAKVLIIESFTDGCSNPEMPIVAISGLSQGLQIATLLGADIGKGKPHLLPENWHALAHDAITAHEAAAKAVRATAGFNF